MTKLSELVTVKRRYCRSINLERDTEISDSIIGYIPTSRAIDALERFFRSYKTPNSIRSWTITGSYGSGKSAFAHFLSSICAPENTKIRKNADSILKGNAESKAFANLANNIISKKGLIRAIVTAQREPISVTVLRALYRGASNFWQYGKGRRPKELKEIKELYISVKDGRNLDNTILIDLLKRLSKASKSGLLLIIDELGKSLEFSAQNQNLDDLYLLQQLAELPSGKTDPKIFIYGLLHQSFSDYAHGLAVAQRNEWSKIQGRFEDISYIESSERMMRLIGQAITKKSGFDAASWAKIWKTKFKAYSFSNSISKNDIASIYPLHPLSAIILPILCSKFSQNDRTLFNFLASREPKSFTQYLKETEYNPDEITTFKLYKLYDYFVESAGISFSMRTKSQKWIEIQSRLHDAKHVDLDARLVLKTIGLLNIVSTSGALRASRNTVLLSMCDNPKNKKEITHWNTIIETLLHEGFITWRKQVDEFRIWEGSDFDVEREIVEQSQSQNISVANLLNENFALSPIVVQRHSYQTGTLRYFERRYSDSMNSLLSAKCENSDSDGLIYYWLGSRDDIQNMEIVPQETSDHTPLIIIGASELNALQIACNEYVTIKKIAKNSIQLQTDGVARREVNQRVLISQRFLEEAIARSFDFSFGQITCWGQGDIIEIDSSSSFQSYLSSICDAHYYKGPFLWNELINRRDLTTQGSAARKKLTVAMLNQEGQERLGMEGFGPECSMFESIFRETDIYVKIDGQWIFSEPSKSSGLYYAWKAIEKFCESANRKQHNINALYNLLEAPPYGVKKGLIPILFLSVILFNKDYISLYLDGSFIPVVGPEHFELFVKKPERFSVKYFEMSGIKAQIFFELEKIFNPKRNDIDPSFRNATILSIVKPLVGFISNLPKYTLHTAEGLNSDSKKVRKALLEAKEPDKLIFYDLPKIFGLNVHIDTSKTDNGIGKQYREKLIQVLKELQSSYEKLIIDNKQLLHEAFGVRSDIAKLREDLRVRSSYLVGHVMEDQLRRFIFACTSDDDDETSWIETVLMIVADKPPRSWTDDDASLFETKLYDLARRFRNLESLQKGRNIEHNSDGFDVRKLTITKPDGNEIQQLVWIDRNKHEKIQSITDHILDNELLKNDINLQQAVATALIERIFGKKDARHSHVIKEAQFEYKRG